MGRHRILFELSSRAESRIKAGGSREVDLGTCEEGRSSGSRNTRTDCRRYVAVAGESFGTGDVSPKEADSYVSMIIYRVRRNRARSGRRVQEEPQRATRSRPRRSGYFEILPPLRGRGGARRLFGSAGILISWDRFAAVERVALSRTILWKTFVSPIRDSRSAALSRGGRQLRVLIVLESSQPRSRGRIAARENSTSTRSLGARLGEEVRGCSDSQTQCDLH